MSIVFRDFKTGERRMFLVSAIARIEPYTLDSVLIEFKNGKSFKTDYCRFVNQ